MDVLKKKKSGFTIIELVIIITIISIVATYALMKFPSTPGINVSAQAQQLANDIRFTQTLAMTSGQDYYLKITGSTYQILSASGTPQTFAFGNITTRLNTGITFGNYLATLPNGLIAFDALGIPYTTNPTAATFLTVLATIPLNGGGSTSTVTITPETGRVSIQ